MELQHFSHEHPLILGEVNDDGEAIVCNVCWENISGSAFSCKNCSFFLHKSCAEFPEEMKHPIHAHSLTLQRAVVRHCDVCRDSIRGFTYQCSPCNFDVDIRCSVRGQHFSSKHQLMILNEDEKNDVDERLSCDVCLQQIIGSTAAYKCTNCSPSIYFHKLCAQLPAEMEHPMHPEHPLALLPVVPNKFRCDGCYIDLKEFIYRCSICNFNLDRRCALRAQKVNHESHKHPLSLVSSSASFECHACGTKREGMSYMCDTCSFWIHKDCASLTPTFKHHTHVHPLTLIYPTHKHHYLFTQHMCRICEDSKEEGRFWLYVCIGCRYCIHVKCSTKTKERKSAIEVEIIDETNLIHLPMADDSVSAIDLFLKQISMGNNKRETELNHFSHHHPLILFGVQGDNNLCYENELLMLNELNKDKICNACVRKISAPFYSCGLCDFFLHKWCAELPNELEQPCLPNEWQQQCHKHQLTLLKKPPEPRGLFYCNGCEYYCNGFAIRCIKNKCLRKGNYNLDVKCASLPKAIIHKVHEHPLFLKNDCVRAGCFYCIHVKCLTKTKERESAIKVENINEANLIHLPMADDSISAIDLFLKQISIGDNKREAELNHFSHHHLLILFDVQGDNNLCYENELLILNELNKDKICNACVRKISAPFYSCGRCDLFLHKWCAELPDELEHPCHPHLLILSKKPPEPRGLFYCRALVQAHLLSSTVLLKAIGDQLTNNGLTNEDWMEEVTEVVVFDIDQ
ncbi:hypothetical protein LOK49_LG02G01733 [Camellia lanceoleosa]|uniref:Uncharacterized protein n=1 Tax=Camellia lanceoleosa TaxID=1840588 RepID=A0ACC0ISC2_9ERIC|nr:hypothetical protein LOK49_LG02G01733 [Camellia lanceoleosa]